MSETQTARWIELAGAANVRDVGGLPTADGRSVRPGRLIRSDNLQSLTEADVRHLVDDLQTRAVADLRTGVEVASEGPGPMTREPAVRVEHLSLFLEPDDVEVSDSDDGPVVLPWMDRDQHLADDERRRDVSGVYRRYLDQRPDSVIAALRLIAASDGATIVHCAAGKDRTGVVVAIALAEVGVPRDAILADYVNSAERVEAIIARLKASRTYAGDLAKNEPIDKHKPKQATMERLFQALDDEYGGAPGWLRSHGWTEGDAAALRHKLLD